VKCHPVERVTGEGRSRSQWENTIVAMQTTRGAVVTPEEFDIVLDYLSKFNGRDAAAVAPAPGGPGPAGRGPRANVGAADRHRVDTTGVVRGQKIYATECVTCHGASARGTERGANLIRSPRMLRDRYGSAIGPYLKAGHPMQTGSAASLTEAQVADISHFIWDRINNTLRGSPDFDVKNVLTGDPAAGHVYFNGPGGCAACHSPTGDLAGYGKRYAPVDIQQRFVFPGSFIPSVTAIADSVTRVTDMKLFNLEDIGPHYAPTLRLWREKFFANIAQVRNLGYPESFVRLWEFYLCYCEGGFAERQLGDVQMLLTKPDCRRAAIAAA
jgi:mono/diheme cytochrome c family protein